jgi:hypothetical protein
MPEYGNQEKGSFMPQLQPVVLQDRATPTPEDHTFQPRDIEKGVGSLTESSGVPVGDNRLTISSSRTTTGRYKPKLTLASPIVETQTINGVDSPKIVRTAYADLTFTFEETSSEEERNNFVGLVRSALSTDKTLINDAIVKLQGIY